MVRIASPAGKGGADLALANTSRLKALGPRSSPASIQSGVRLSGRGLRERPGRSRPAIECEMVGAHVEGTVTAGSTRLHRRDDQAVRPPISIAAPLKWSRTRYSDVTKVSGPGTYRRRTCCRRPASSAARSKELAESSTSPPLKGRSEFEGKENRRRARRQRHGRRHDLAPPGSPTSSSPTASTCGAGRRHPDRLGAPAGLPCRDRASPRPSFVGLGGSEIAIK